ncbi:hypothetical protein A0H81_13617 [Grifola frondosa]|uniref:Uncharacterized protein n=1 Tax=Grifola frondosa TaxID=5627 RepID=A0A1C7LPA3_GRIFR|nr:hypothetical protein A0H81_13617 [Grifola frondosa]
MASGRISSEDFDALSTQFLEPFTLELCQSPSIAGSALSHDAHQCQRPSESRYCGSPDVGSTSEFGLGLFTCGFNSDTNITSLGGMDLLGSLFTPGTDGIGSISIYSPSELHPMAHEEFMMELTQSLPFNADPINSQLNGVKPPAVTRLGFYSSEHNVNVDGFSHMWGLYRDECIHSVDVQPYDSASLQEIHRHSLCRSASLTPSASPSPSLLSPSLSYKSISPSPPSSPSPSSNRSSPRRRNSSTRARPRNVQITPGSLMPNPDSNKCPYCPYEETNHRRPDLRRHIETHRRKAVPPKWVCYGLPLEDAASNGIFDISDAKLFGDVCGSWIIWSATAPINDS